MNCKDVIRQSSDYIDGELTIVVKQEVETHLKECPHCTSIVTQTKTTLSIFYGCEAADLPPDVRTKLHEALRRRIAEAGT